MITAAIECQLHPGYEIEAAKVTGKLLELKCLTKGTTNNYEVILESLKSIQEHVLFQYLPYWENCQYRCFRQLKTTSIITIKLIQEWYQSLEEILLEVHEQLNKLVFNESLNKLQKTTFNLLQNLIQHSLIIEKQPPQVAKTNTAVPITARLLIKKLLKPNNSQGSLMSLVKKAKKRSRKNSDLGVSVSVKLIQEESAGLLVQSIKAAAQEESYKQLFKVVDSLNVGELDNCKESFNIEDEANASSVIFNKLTIKKRAEKEKHRNEKVTHKKEVFLLESGISTVIGDFKLFKLSFPVAIKAHNNQNYDVWAAVVWDNAFCNQLYQVRPEAGPWSLLSNAFDRYFTHEVGHGLNEINLKYLYEKCCNRKFNTVDIETATVTKSEFCINELANCGCTFFEFFYDATRLVKECLLTLWQRDYVIGFISRQEIENLLAPCCNGTFLLRFSESEPGAITVAYKTERGVKHIKPKTKEDLCGEGQGMIKRILNYKELKFLYPNVEKGKLEVLQDESNKSKSKSKPGYVDDETRFELVDDSLCQVSSTNTEGLNSEGFASDCIELASDCSVVNLEIAPSGSNYIMNYPIDVVDPLQLENTAPYCSYSIAVESNQMVSCASNSAPSDQELGEISNSCLDFDSSFNCNTGPVENIDFSELFSLLEDLSETN